MVMIQEFLIGQWGQLAPHSMETEAVGSVSWEI